MYITANLRNNIQEWRNRLCNAPYTQINRQLDSFVLNLENKSIIKGILLELLAQANSLEHHPFDKCRNALTSNLLCSIFENKRFSDNAERAMYHYSLIKVLQEDDIPLYMIPAIVSGKVQTYDVPKIFVEKYVDPLVYYIYDELDEGSSVLYLLEKYKKRCEWFEKDTLRNLYDKSVGHQERVLDKDLRQFLFEQGIDYPFSTPSSPSGAADVVGILQTDDPLVLEVKIFDSSKNYGKNRVYDGFRQIVSYSNDYNKPVGYLLIFNMDKLEINLVTKENDKNWPIKVVFASKTYFIIFVNIPPCDTESASKRGKIEKITITEEELTSELYT